MKLIIANTILGRAGNIGFRYGHILDKDPEMYFFGRGVSKKYKSFNAFSVPLMGSFSRLLNAFRIYLYTGFNHRKWDILVFNLSFIIFYYGVLKWKLRARDSKRILLMQEFSPFIINKMKSKGFKVILDMPIAPENYSRFFEERYGSNLGIKHNSFVYNLQESCFIDSDIVLVPSDFVGNWVEDFAQDARIIKVPFGADNLKTKFFEKINPKPGCDFYFAGMVSKRKGIEVLLDCWESFDNDHRLHLCGRVTPEIKSILDKKSYRNVFTPGFVDISTYFKPGGVYVFPSFLEGSSKSIYEAMSYSYPIICTEESGSIVQDGINGSVIPAVDKESLMVAMSKYANFPSLRFKHGKESARIVSEYTWQRYASTVVSIMNALQ